MGAFPLRYTVSIDDFGGACEHVGERRNLSLAGAWRVVQRHQRRGVRRFARRQLRTSSPSGAVAQCLTLAGMARANGDTVGAREWLAKARVWRFNFARELEANAAWIAANPETARAFGVVLSPVKFERHNWGAMGGTPSQYRAAVIGVRS